MEKKIKKYKIIIFILILLLIFFGGYFIIHFESNYWLKRWFREVSPDNKYIIVGNKKGDSFPFPGGYSEIEISVKFADKSKDNHKGFHFTTSIRNGAVMPDEDDYDIEWKDDYALLTLYNDDGTNQKFRFYWEDYL